MKKLLFILLCAISINSLHAQSLQSKVYCEILGTQKLLSLKVNIRVDFGQNPYANSNLVDENGKKITFNSMVDAMNYMGKLGWEFESAYVITHGSVASAQNVYHWLLSKYISDDENINDGFTTKRQFKDMQHSQDEQQERAVGMTALSLIFPIFAKGYLVYKCHLLISYDAVYIIFLLSETVELTCCPEAQFLVDGNCFCIILKDFQKILPDTGFFKVRNRILENILGKAFPSIFLGCTGSCVIGGKYAIEYPCPIECECHYLVGIKCCKRQFRIISPSL